MVIEGDERGVKCPSLGAKCHIVIHKQHDDCTCQAKAAIGSCTSAQRRDALKPASSNSPHRPFIGATHSCHFDKLLNTESDPVSCIAELWTNVVWSLSGAQP